jgi:hypothetical protein
MDFTTSMHIFWAVICVWIAWTAYRVRKHRVSPTQIVMLKEGETLVGVIHRRHGQYVFVGTELERYQDNLTPEEIRLLKQELYKGYE